MKKEEMERKKKRKRKRKENKRRRMRKDGGCEGAVEWGKMGFQGLTFEMDGGD